MKQDQSGKEVLEDLKNLRSFEGDEAEFWSRFLRSVSAVCKSPCIFVLIKNESVWSVVKEYYIDESLKPFNDFLGEGALSLAERAYENGFAYESLTQSLPRFHVSVGLEFRIETAGINNKSVLFIVTDKSDNQHFNDIVVRTQLISDVPASYYSRNLQPHPTREIDTDNFLTDVMDIANMIVHKDFFGLACMTLVNEMAHRFDCSQVSFGWLKDKYIRIVAVSHLETFDRHSEAVKELERVCEESYEQNEIVASPAINDLFVVDKMHGEYSKKHGLSQVISIPFLIDENVVAVLTCEKKDSVFTPSAVEALKMVASQTVPWLNVLYFRHLWFGKRIGLKVMEMLRSWLGVEHSLIKAVSIILALALIYTFIGEWDYKVEGSATLRTDAVSFVSAPFDGIVQDVKVREGNEVKKGDELLNLDTKELLLREAQSLADTVRYSREVDKNRANSALADMKIAHARLDESRAGLDKIRYQLGQATAISPFGGIVVEGDRQKLINAPVSKGDVLLKIAKLEGMYLHIKINERDIGDIKQGAKGELIFLGRPWTTYKITVERIIPMAEVDQREGNIFIARASIGDSPETWWRPGMSGLAKIESGSRKVIWILTHRVIEFIRIYFWW